MQDKIFKVKIFKVTHKSVKSVKVFSLEIFRLYGNCQKLCCNYYLQGMRKFLTVLVLQLKDRIAERRGHRKLHFAV